MKIIPILSSIIIVSGCFMPWMQLGAFITIRGIDNPDGTIMLVAGILAGGLSFYNYSQEKPKNTWVYLVIGAIGLIIAYIDLNDITSRAEKIAESLGELNSIFGGNSDVSYIKFIGSGLYIVCGGSIGLILSGIGAFNSNQTKQSMIAATQSDTEIENIELTKKCPDCAETIKKGARVCRFCKYKFSVKELQTTENIEDESIIVTENKNKDLIELNQMITSQKKKFYGGGMTNEIQTIMENLFTTKDQTVYLLNAYKTISKSDLVKDIKGLSSSYVTIKRNLSIFIDLDIVEENYPHDRKIKPTSNKV